MKTNDQGEERPEEPSIPAQDGGRSKEAQESQDAQQTQAYQQTREGPQAPAYQPPVQEVQAKKPEHAWLKPVAIGLLVVAVGVGSFFGGMAAGDDGKPKQVAVGGAGQGGQAMPGQPGGNLGGEMPGRMGAMGEVTAVSSSSISVEDLRSGETGTYSINSSTQIEADGETADTGDIEVGDKVRVVPSDSDESVAARIIINPAMGGPGGQEGMPPGERPQPDAAESTST